MLDYLHLVEDKNFLRCLVENDFKEPIRDLDLSSLSFALLQNLHSTDPELRDEFSFSILTKIIAAAKLSDREMHALLDLALSEEHLLFGIGENNTDTVFARAFAVLVVAAIVEVDSKRRFLTNEQMNRTTDMVLAYARSERDRRGFVEGKGWAHTVAHTSDALDACAQHPVTKAEMKITILEVIANLASLPEPLCHMEDDRLAFATLRLILAGNVPSASLEAWIRTLDVESGPSQASTVQHANIQHFLRSLYCLLLWQRPEHALLPVILDQLKRLNIFYRYGIL